MTAWLYWIGKYRKQHPYFKLLVPENQQPPVFQCPAFEYHKNTPLFCYIWLMFSWDAFLPEPQQMYPKWCEHAE